MQGKAQNKPQDNSVHKQSSIIISLEMLLSPTRKERKVLISYAKNQVIMHLSTVAAVVSHVNIVASMKEWVVDL